MTGPSVSHLINQLRADAHDPGTAPAVALEAADALERLGDAIAKALAVLHSSSVPLGANALWQQGQVMQQAREILSTSIHTRQENS